MQEAEVKITGEYVSRQTMLEVWELPEILVLMKLIYIIPNANAMSSDMFSKACLFDLD